MKIATLFIFGFLLAALRLAGAEIELPREAKAQTLTEEDGKSWRQIGSIPLAYTAACRQFDLTFRKQGWRRVKTVAYDSRQWKKLEIWERSGERIMLHLWRDDTGVTGFSWGIYKT